MEKFLKIWQMVILKIKITDTPKRPSPSVINGERDQVTNEEISLGNEHEKKKMFKLASNGGMG